MLKFPHLSRVSQNPNPSNLSFLGNIVRPSLVVFVCIPPMASPKLVAEYAKSNRSTCKICRKTIPAGSLRLGLVSKDPRGFDLPKWHHLDCFPTQSQSLVAAEQMKGFSSLKECDQEALRKLEAAASSNQSSKEDYGVDEDETNRSKDKSLKVRKRDETVIEEFEDKSPKELKVGGTNSGGIEEFEEKSSKKTKLSGAGKNYGLEVAFSISEIKDKYKDATLLSGWKAFSTIIFREQEDGLRDSEKIAAFDFDGCLVNTSVKRIGPDAWSLLYPSIPEKLQRLYNSGYKLVIFTNESNIERWKNKRQQAVDSKIGRLDNFIKRVEVPIQVFIACGLAKNKDQTDDPFRKPKPGMWRIMEEHFNSGIAIDMDQSFYVGDAAGRINDHSDADIKFAQAIGLKFHLPEEFFCS